LILQIKNIAKAGIEFARD